MCIDPGGGIIATVITHYRRLNRRPSTNKKTGTQEPECTARHTFALRFSGGCSRRDRKLTLEIVIVRLLLYFYVPRTPALHSTV